MKSILREHPNANAMELTAADIDRLDPKLKDRIVKTIHAAFDAGEAQGERAKANEAALHIDALTDVIEHPETFLPEGKKLVITEAKNWKTENV